jgi:GDPmannose 4,6-dehydratase
MSPFERVVITGIGGQDGSWLAARLLGEGITVVGCHRPSSDPRNWRHKELGLIDHPNLQLCPIDLQDANACRSLISDVAPQAIFHLAGQSRVAESFSHPIGSIQANGMATLNLLEALRATSSQTHIVLASSAEIFGVPSHSPQDESTPKNAASPYGLSKLIAHAGVGSWRASFGLSASSAILFNHESELRDPAFVTRKITQSVARIVLGLEGELRLGNLDARRDFGYAPEYVDAMIRMAQQPTGDDYVLATGNAASIRDFASACFAAAGLPLEWRGHGVEEVGVERASGTIRVRVDAKLFRPVDAPLLVGDARKAREALDFVPQVDLSALTARMLEADLVRERRQEAR